MQVKELLTMLEGSDPESEVLLAESTQSETTRTYISYARTGVDPIFLRFNENFKTTIRFKHFKRRE
jgi:hypothetical protein